MEEYRRIIFKKLSTNGIFNDDTAKCHDACHNLVFLEFKLNSIFHNACKIPVVFSLNSRAMNSLSCAKKLIPLVSKYSVARHTNEIPSIYFPAERNRIAQAPLTQVDRLHLSWFESTWKKTKNMVLDNWESAGLIKRRKSDDENRKSGAGSNVSQDDNTELPENDISKAKNKAQRHLAENWDAIKQANAKTNRSFVDYGKENATIDELSKSAKETGTALLLLRSSSLEFAYSFNRMFQRVS